MPKGVYPRKGNLELSALAREVNPVRTFQAQVYDLELRVADLERRLVQANEYFSKGYIPPNV
jgi:hypothetical protein